MLSIIFMMLVLHNNNQLMKLYKRHRRCWLVAVTVQKVYSRFQLRCGIFVVNWEFCMQQLHASPFWHVNNG